MLENKARILLVDDSAINIEILGKLLKENNFEVIISSNGERALEVIKKDEIDLILLDIMMPNMDGYEVCKKIKNDYENRDIPIIFMTALDKNEDKIKAFEFGAVDYITKPFFKQEVLARINVHVKLKRTHDYLRQVAITDELTGVYNRRFAYSVLKRQIALTKREKSFFTVCFIDLNEFKIINDKYGHEMGDQVLIDFTYILKKALRETDYIFRMGGDEFLLILPGSKISDSQIITERINKLIEKLFLDFSRLYDKIDFSFGFAEFDETCDLSEDDLIKKADDAMYKLKKTTK